MAGLDDWDLPGTAERLYRELVEAAPDAVLVVEAGAPHYLLVNTAAEQLLGYERDELLRMSSTDLVAPDERPRLAEARRTLEASGWWRGEWHLRRKDGSVVPVEATTTRHAVGGRVVYQGLFRDITERKQIEDELVRREAQLAAAQALAHVGSWEWDILEDRVSWSDENFRVFGLVPQPLPLPLETVLDRVAPADREHVLRVLEAARTTGEGWDFYVGIVRPDGTERIVQSRGVVVRGSSGRPERMLGASQDVTEQKQLEHLLRQREQQFRSLLDHATDSIIQFDRSLRIAYVNPASERLLGRLADELLGKTSEEAGLSAARLPNWERILRHVFDTGREMLVDVPVIASSGEERLHETRLSPVLGSDGSVESVLAIARDVSEHRWAQEQRERLYHELMERESRLREMVEEILLAQGHRRLREHGASVLPLLTPRERDVLRLLAEGHSNYQIGRELNLTAGTVRNHISRILPKLGARDRTQAAVRALEFGLLDTPPR